MYELPLPSVIYYCPFQGDASVVVEFRIALWPSVGKELSSWLSPRADFILCRRIVHVPFPFGV